MDYGAHPSARDPEATQCCRLEALEKVEQGFCKVMPWSKLRERYLEGELSNLKISPIAAIPHKSRKYRMILDLSLKGQGRNGEEARPAVNELTDKDAAPNHSMKQLGQVIPRIIHTLANCAEEDGPMM